MDPSIANINVPLDSLNSVIAEQHNLRLDIHANNKEHSELKNHVARLITSAVASKANESNTNSSSSKTLKTIKSVNSIQDIPDSLSNDDQNIPNVEEFVAMTADGKISISDELLKELYEANCRIDAINEVGSNLQQRWCELDKNIKDIRKDINKIINDINNIKQYFKIDNLLFHRFRLPHNKLSSLEFSKYIADQINILLPHLPIRISIHHISTAHPLPTKAKKSNVVVVRFCNRFIKDMIYESRHLIGHGVSITEHLTDHTLSIVKKAEELFGRFNVHTDSCKIFVNCNGKFNLIKSVEDAHKLYVNYCERIGTNDIHSPSVPTTYNYRHSYSNYRLPSYSNIVKSSSFVDKPNTPNLNINAQRGNRRHQSQPRRSKYYRGKPSTGYSVRNRVY